MSDARKRRHVEPPAFAGRVPPHDLDAEAAVLSACMLDRAAADEALALIKPEHFYSDANKLVFDAIASLAEIGTPIDVVNVASLLRSREQIKRVGDVKYLSMLVDATPAVANVASHAVTVWSRWQRRRILASLHELVADGYGDLDDAMYRAKVDGVITASLSTSLNATGPRKLRDVLVDTMNAIKEASGGSAAVPSDLLDLDGELDGGARPGELIIIAGRPGSGKTSLLHQWLMSAATPRQNGLFGWAYNPSLEMPDVQCGGRFLSNRAGINGRQLRRGTLDQDEWSQIASAASDLASMPIFVAEHATTITRIAAEARQLQRKAQAEGERLAMVGIDYLQILDLPDSENHEREIAAATRASKRLAKELGCPVVLLSQLNRGVEARDNKRPLMKDLKASGAIEADADIILLLYRDEYYNPDTDEPGVAEINIAKQRDGETKTVKVRFVKECTRFENLGGERWAPTPEAEQAPGWEWER